MSCCPNLFQELVSALLGHPQHGPIHLPADDSGPSSQAPITEKPARHVITQYRPDRPHATADQIAADVINILLEADTNGPALRAKLESAVSTTGWVENVAKRILEALEWYCKPEHVEKAGALLKNSISKAATEAWEFAKEHPYLCTIIALGVLVLLTPWVLEALGFGELGPIEGSWAALWQSSIGDVPEGHLYTYFQRLGMRWAPKRAGKAL